MIRKSIFDVLDHGLYEYLPPNIRSSLCGLWVAVVEDNHQEMRRFVVVINENYSRKISMSGSLLHLSMIS